MMATTLDLVQAGELSTGDLNRMAGLVINPFDVVGVGVYLGAGAHVRTALLWALPGVFVGLLLRAYMHLLIF